MKTLCKTLLLAGALLGAAAPAALDAQTVYRLNADDPIDATWLTLTNSNSILAGLSANATGNLSANRTATKQSFASLGTITSNQTITLSAGITQHTALFSTALASNIVIALNTTNATTGATIDLYGAITAVTANSLDIRSGTTAGESIASFDSDQQGTFYGRFYYNGTAWRPQITLPYSAAVNTLLRSSTSLEDFRGLLDIQAADVKVDWGPPDYASDGDPISTFLGNLAGDVGGMSQGTGNLPDLNALGVAGLLVRTNADTNSPTWALRSVTGTNITVTNGTGAAGNIALSLPASGVTAATYGNATRWPSFTVDSTGRITGASNTSVGGTNTILYTNTAGNITSITTANNAVLTTNGTGVPAWQTAGPLPWTNTVPGGGTGVATFTAGIVASPGTTTALTTITNSAGLAGNISDETGSGALVFAVSPALTGTPTVPTANVNVRTTQAASLDTFINVMLARRIYTEPLSGMSTSSGGSGSVGLLNLYGFVVTNGAAGNGTVKSSSSGSVPLRNPTGNRIQINWSQPMWMGIVLYNSITGDGVIRVTLGKGAADGIGALVDKGIGFELFVSSGIKVRTIAHDGSSGTNSSNVNWGAGVNTYILYSDGAGNLTLYYISAGALTQMATQTGAPTGTSSNSDVLFQLEFSQADNNLTEAEFSAPVFYTPN